MTVVVRQLSFLNAILSIKDQLESISFPVFFWHIFCLHTFTVFFFRIPDHEQIQTKTGLEEQKTICDNEF